MVQNEKQIDSEVAADDREPYRRLVELQKQMIDLVRQHERTKNECAVLRTQLLNEMTGKRRPLDFRRIIHCSAAGWMKNLMDPWKPRLESHPQPQGSFLSAETQV